MKLTIISSESDIPRETELVRSLFRAGLQRFDLRKPAWSAQGVESFLGTLSAGERARLVIHSHPGLAARWGLGGTHEPDQGEVLAKPVASFGLTSRACHDLKTLSAALGRYDAVVVSPLFESISKPGYGPSKKFTLPELKALLNQRTPPRRRTVVYALGGITAANTMECGELGFDGVMVLGAIWNSNDPLEAFLRLKEVCGRGHEPLKDPAGAFAVN